MRTNGNERMKESGSTLFKGKMIQGTVVVFITC